MEATGQTSQGSVITSPTVGKEYLFYAGFWDGTTSYTKGFKTKAQIKAYLKQNPNITLAADEIIRGYAIPVKKVQAFAF